MSKIVIFYFENALIKENDDILKINFIDIESNIQWIIMQIFLFIHEIVSYSQYFSRT